jgi:hypothetical protein
MRRWIWLMLLTMGVLCCSPRSVFGDAGPEQQVLHEYLKAYVRNDYGTLKQYLPTKEENLFGPYPFIGKPEFTRAKVDDRQALVEFTGTVDDKQFPNKGAILCYCLDGVWRVRQVLFYQKIPSVFNLPEKSVTEKDRKSEPVVTTLAERFLENWKRGDTAAIQQDTYRWVDRQSDLNKRITVNNYRYNGGQTRWGEPFGVYEAKLTYKWGILSYTMRFNGGFVMVKEDETWKIRGNIMVFYFE